MRKILTISVAFIMLIAGMQFSIDRHFCGGELTATKFSVTGKLASCGMEETEHSFPNHNSFDQRCCEDQLTCVGISNNYIPEYFNLPAPYAGKNIHTVPVADLTLRYSNMNFSTSSSSPPGENLKTGLTLSEIRVYRI
jgi:hypothetical protein